MNKKYYNVVAAVIVKDNKVFCSKRSNMDSYGSECALKWEFPGGKIELGESYEAALKREILEELDTIIEVDSFICETNHQYETFDVTVRFYVCHITNGKLILKEHLEGKFVSVEEMLKLDFLAADIKILPDIKAYLINNNYIK